MKKYTLMLLSSFIAIMLSASMVFASSDSNYMVKQAINLYKSKNYSTCYSLLNDAIKKDPSNSLAYYYLAMTASQMGHKNEAIENYNKVVSLTNDVKLRNYALRGAACLEDVEKCQAVRENVDKVEEFIKAPYGTGFSDKVRSNYEKNKIENLMREMNRSDSIEKSKFKEYKDFSSAIPSNDEIVAAMNVLQRAGFTFNNGSNDLSLLTGSSNNNYDLFQMLSNKNNNSSVNPQLIQSLLTNGMSLGL